MAPLVLFAQTEVEGEVSGVWTSEGNPYIVIDSTWVPEGERLTLRAGVRLLFEEDQGLYVFGSIEATGSEEDSVYIRVAEGVEHWKGLRFYGRDRTEWSYASIICPDSAFVLDPGCSLTFDHCLVDAGERFIAGDLYLGADWGARNCNITISQSIVKSRMRLITAGGSITANHTFFDFGGGENDRPGFRGEGTSYRLTNCEVIGALRLENGGYAIVDSCRFLMTPLGRRSGVATGGRQGRITESYIEGGAGASFSYGAVIPIMNNTILGNVGFGHCNADISGCNIGGLLNIRDCGSVTVRNSTINSCLWISDTDSVTIDSCFFVHYDQEYHFISVRDVSRLEVTRSVLAGFGHININTDVQTILDHNTFIYDSIGYAAINRIGQDLRMTNNIFMTVVPGGRLFSMDEMPSVEYNCVWGFEFAAGPPNEPIPLDDIDSSNIIANPFIEWDGIIPNLSSNSPCINRGDPEFDLDPDSSRSDIGARFFDHRLDFVRPTESAPYPEFIGISAYPNPFNNKLNISFSSPGISPVSIRLVDMTGRAVIQTTHIPTPTGFGFMSMNATSLPSGNYILLIGTSQYTRAVSVYCLK